MNECFYAMYKTSLRFAAAWETSETSLLIYFQSHSVPFWLQASRGLEARGQNPRGRGRNPRGRGRGHNPRGRGQVFRPRGRGQASRPNIPATTTTTTTAQETSLGWFHPSDGTSWVVSLGLGLVDPFEWFHLNWITLSLGFRISASEVMSCDVFCVYFCVFLCFVMITSVHIQSIMSLCILCSLKILVWNRPLMLFHIYLHSLYRILHYSILIRQFCSTVEVVIRACLNWEVIEK